MVTTLRFGTVTPEETVYSEDVELVTLEGVEGQMGTYPQHVPLMTQMAQGEIIGRKDGRDRFIASGEGMIVVTTTRVSVAFEADRIDEAKADEAMRRAEARFREKPSDEEVASVNASLARSLAQSRVRRREHR